MKIDQDGNLVPGLAKSYTVSDDGLIYRFEIKDNAYFHDGTPVTADDIIFTIEKVTDDRVQSFRQASWSGVGVVRVDDKTLEFKLNEPLSSFLRNTTIGILPKHLWENVEPAQIPFSELNIEPVGAGPYRVRAIKRPGSGIPASYSLEPFKNYALGAPYIQEIELIFYEDQQTLNSAYRRGDVESIRAVSAESIDDLVKENSEIVTESLPRLFGIFFNQNKNSALLDKSVRKALLASINKESIIQEALSGFGKTIESPLPLHLKDRFDLLESAEEVENDPRKILSDGGWEYDEEKQRWIFEKNNDIMELSLMLATPDVPELEKTARLIAQDWQKIGVKVEISVFEEKRLGQEVIRPRDYDALLFGMVIADPLDLFAFWHSSQRNDPGLNISLYANIEVDKALRSLRESEEKADIRKSLEIIEKEIINDVPAIFLYSPEFIYVIPKKIKGLKLGIISNSGDRFSNVHEWYIETNRKWKI